eukprot:1161797-Pelagomonas_calceolata.AAC.1
MLTHTFPPVPAAAPQWLRSHSHSQLQKCSHTHIPTCPCSCATVAEESLRVVCSSAFACASCCCRDCTSADSTPWSRSPL